MPGCPAICRMGLSCRREKLSSLMPLRMSGLSSAREYRLGGDALEPDDSTRNRDGPVGCA